MNKRYAQIITCILIYASSTAKAHSVEYRASLGLGFQYGVYGLMNSLVVGSHKFRLSTIVLAFGTLGYDYRFKNSYSIGVQHFYALTDDYLGVNGANFNYYFNGYDAPGWMIGFDLLNDGTATVPFFSIGYDFVRK